MNTGVHAAPCPFIKATAAPLAAVLLWVWVLWGMVLSGVLLPAAVIA
jgi:hypothetical protein